MVHADYFFFSFKNYQWILTNYQSEKRIHKVKNVFQVFVENWITKKDYQKCQGYQTFENCII